MNHGLTLKTLWNNFSRSKVFRLVARCVASPSGKPETEKFFGVHLYRRNGEGKVPLIPLHRACA
ncbi:MAG TPA: hypothetical protein VNU95_12300, partial [Candidatus Acidoferrales bacterium]|nr:hypothetical protein [Candidatus Acidoferrales bacterium]